MPSSILTYSYNASGLVTQVKKNNVPLVKFFYNDRNHRLKKETYGGTNGDKILSTHYVRDVGGQVMAIYMEPQNATPKVAEYPVYGSGRIGIYKPGGTPKTLYELTDHLGNVRTVFSVTDTNSGLTNEGYSDYYPFGMPMPGRNMVGDYRYAFQGQEKDPETGKEAFELRLWDGRIGRWLTTDPAGQYASPYLGMGNNPISLTDPTGGSTSKPLDDYKLNKDGSLTLIAETDFADRIFNEGGDFVQLEYDGQVANMTSEIINYGGSKLGEHEIRHLTFNDVNKATEVFEFLNFYSDVEWSQIIDNGSKSYVGSSFNPSSDLSGTHKIAQLIYGGATGDFIKRHSHPASDRKLYGLALGFIRAPGTHPSKGDVQSAKNINKYITGNKIKINIMNQVYDAVHGNYINFNHRYIRPVRTYPQPVKL